MIRKLIFCSLFLLSTLIPSQAFSQECGPEMEMGEEDPFNPFCEDLDNEVPLDGGLTCLLAAGAIYGLKAFSKKKEVKEDQLSA